MKILLITSLLLFCPTLVFATTDTFQEGVSGYSGAKDAGMDYGNATTNYETATSIGVARPYTSAWQLSGAFSFDVSSISSTATVSSATVEFWHETIASDGYGPDISIHRAFKPWIESEITYNRWDDANSYEWGSAGANSANDSGTDNTTDSGGDDRTVTPEDTIVFNTWQGYDAAYVNFDITSLVQGWVDGTYNNYGFILRGSDDSEAKTIYFQTSEHTTTAWRPKLTVTYTVSGGSTRNKMMTIY